MCWSTFKEEAKRIPMSDIQVVAEVKYCSRSNYNEREKMLYDQNKKLEIIFKHNYLKLCSNCFSDGLIHNIPFKIF